MIQVSKYQMIATASKHKKLIQHVQAIRCRGKLYFFLRSDEQSSQGCPRPRDSEENEVQQIVNRVLRIFPRLAVVVTSFPLFIIN